ncbi:recombinase family protein [Lysinibacillus sp. NPDC093210]|uniref:recombinase family protein n=1 Tax=Lysinibacillus sp. NPDC093210 TaxID=3364133 RepID=UPI00382DE20E
MSIGHKFTYFENDVYVITEEERPESTPTSLPWNIYKDNVKLAAGYIRWSDEKQNSGHSHSIQERAIIIKAQSLGFQGVVIFVEAAKSAYHYPVYKRKKMSELKEFILSNSNANSVIFYDESRVTRDITDFYKNIIVPLREKKTQLKLFSTQHDGEWNENDPLIQIKLALDHDESVKKASRVRNAQENIFDKNKRRPPASNPYGYSKVNDEVDDLLPDENAGIVKLIFYLYSFGHSDEKIAELLELSQIPSPAGYGNWSDSSVRYILNNLWYIGNLAWDSRMSFSNSKKKSLGEFRLLTNYHPALIEMGLWETTQFFRNLKSKRNRMDSPFILKNLVFCKECGVKLETKNQTSAKSKTDGSIYFCPMCKCKLKKDVLNKIVLQDFAVRWGREIKLYPQRLKNEMMDWKKVCRKKVSDLKAGIEKLRFTISTLNPNDENYNVILEIAQLQLKSMENDKTLYVNTEEKIEQLFKENVTIELIDRFKQDIHSYSNVEKRSILLLSIKAIFYDFKRDDFEIEYRLSPYVEIETEMKSSKETRKAVV